MTIRAEADDATNFSTVNSDPVVFGVQKRHVGDTKAATRKGQHAVVVSVLDEAHLFFEDGAGDWVRKLNRRLVLSIIAIGLRLVDDFGGCGRVDIE